MDKLKIEREAIIFSEQEKGRLINCLKYVRHRLTEHKSGFVEDVKFVDYIIKNLER